MIEIKLNDFVTWFQEQLDQKYTYQIQNLKRVVLVFYNLAGQIIDVYYSIRLKMVAYASLHQQTENSEHRQAVFIINKSLFILSKMADTEKYPNCLDSYFCEKFVKLFEQNLNVLCTLYHSFSHMELGIANRIKTERERIVEGINRLYNLHSKIKEYSKVHAPILRQIYQHKKLFNAKIGSIQAKLSQYKLNKQKDSCFQQFESQAIEFYGSLQQSMTKASSQPEVKRSFMKSYFSLLHQLYSSQARLEILLEGPMSVCQEIKNKKKKNSFGNQENLSQYSKWVNALLKPSSTVKNTRKIKVEEFMKYTYAIIKDKEHNFDPSLSPSHDEIEDCVNIIIEITKEQEKVEQSGLLTAIAEYRESLVPNGTKKIVNRLIEYQFHMARFYSLHEEVKELQRLVQCIVMDELAIKVNILLDYSI